jgi:tRNA dimethylallyltransferase
VRAAIDAEAAERGWPAMHAALARVDAATAARLAPHDAQRIQRALEVVRLTGRPLSSWQGQRKPAAEDPGAVRIALVPRDRARLHREIASRFDAILAAGLVDELASLRERHALDPSMPSMRCVGYRQAWTFLDGGVDRDGFRASGIAATRQLAKRQLTWLRSTPAEAFDPWEPDLSARVLAHVERPGPMR